MSYVPTCESAYHLQTRLRDLAKSQRLGEYERATLRAACDWNGCLLIAGRLPSIEQSIRNERFQRRCRK